MLQTPDEPAGAASRDRRIQGRQNNQTRTCALFQVHLEILVLLTITFKYIRSLAVYKNIQLPSNFFLVTMAIKI